MSVCDNIGSAIPSVGTGERRRLATARREGRSNATWSQTRIRIIEAAERLVRQVGHRKTTVADTAQILCMSTGNIYRFFQSREAVCEAACRRVLEEPVSAAIEIARRSATAEERLHSLLRELARLNIERLRTDRLLHQLLVLAASENRPSVTEYVERIDSILAAIVADGMQCGEFRQGDARQAGRCIHTSMTPFLHPALILEPAADGRAALDDMVGFCLGALRSSQLQTQEQRP